MTPLQFAANSPKPIIGTKEINTIFNDVQTIYNFAKQMLKLFKERLNSWDSKTGKIGDVFLQMVRVSIEKLEHFCVIVCTRHIPPKTPRIISFLMLLFYLSVN